MRRRSQRDQDLVPLDSEIEATARRRSGEARRRKEQATAMAGQEQRVLRDYAMPQSSGITSSIVNPTIEANNFELRPALISLVEKDQFGGHPSENPNMHLRNFLAKCDTVKLNGVPADAIRMRLFPFSLRDRASDWLQNETPNSFTTWELLSRAFLSKYFPPGKTAKLRTDITSFSQRDGESLYEAWERFKDLQRQCPHHGVPDWLLVQTFYNGLEQSVKISVDAAAGGALMGKSIEAARALLEEMASNNYHWSSERATAKRGGGRHEIDAVTLLASRVDALAQRLDKVVIPPSTTVGSNMGTCAYCETCGVQGHTTAECYNAPPAMEHVNAYQGYQPPPQHSSYPTAYNQGGKGYSNPSYTTHVPPSQNAMRPLGFQPRAAYAPQPQPSPPPQSSTAHLESMLAQFIATQSKTNEMLTASVNRLSSQFDVMAAHQKAMDTQIAQIAQQVSHLSRPQGHLPSQAETNPTSHVNAISTVRVGLEESPVMVLQETTSAPVTEGVERQGEGRLTPVVMEDTAPPIRPYQPRVPYPQRLAWAKILQLEPKYARFLEMLRRIYADTPFLETLKKAPGCLQFVRDFLSKKGEPERGSVMPLGRACSSFIQSPVKLQDPGDFCIPCCIGDIEIERALCDLGASVSIMPFSLYRRLKLLELIPTTTLIQLADCSTRQPVGVLEDVPVRVGEFVIPCDFFVVDMDESPSMPIILGRPFLATAGAEINVQAGTLSFCICGERVDFCFPPPTSHPVLAPLSPSGVPAHSSPSTAAPGAAILDVIEDSHPLLRGSSSFSAAMSTYSGPTAICPGEVGYHLPHFYPSHDTPPTLPPSTIWR